MTSATWAALYGGLIIGIASGFLLLMNGRHAGISGIAEKAFFDNKTNGIHGLWYWMFLIGLVVGGGVCHWLLDIPVPSLQFDNPWLAIISGLLVGIGVRLSEGCTSGHGVYGISTLSLRSIVATLTFIGVGMLTVFVVGRVLS